MANTFYTEFYEKIDSMSPSQSSFGMSGGVANMDFIISRFNIVYVLSKILGRCRINADGSLNRDLPMAHPEFNWLYASEITNLQGIGAAGAIDGGGSGASITDLVDRNLPKFLAIYEKYKVSVKFEPRPYLLLTDDQCHAYRNPNLDERYYTPNNNNPVIFQDWCEYLRFTKIEVEASAEQLSADMGLFQFHTADFAAPQPISKSLGAGPKITVVTENVKITWFFVPYKMVTSKNWAEAYGKINQESGTIPALQFFGYDQASLLFNGITVNTYPGPYPAYPIALGVPPVQNDIVNSIWGNKYCDITLDFTHRQVPQDAKGGDPAALPFLVNSIIENHNRMPHIGRMKYYYVNNSIDPVNGRPPFWSYNMKKLFRFD